MKIDVLCNDGSPLGVTTKTIYGDARQVGVGGAELAMLTLCEAWQKAGHRVRLYNNPREESASPFEQLSISSFKKDEKRDILIVFRSPNDLAKGARGMKVWWSCDQYTVGNFSDFSKCVDKIVCISDFHSAYFERVYSIKNTIVIDLPVREWDYADNVSLTEKEVGRLLYASIPQRGLDILAQIWGKIIEIAPIANIVITSDYRLWGTDYALDGTNRSLWVKWREYGNVKYRGAIPRKQFVKEQARAQILAYPCIYDELFCITCAEAQWNGVLPITSSFGALGTTNMGIIIDGEPRTAGFQEKFAETVAYYLNNPDQLVDLQKSVMDKARKRFGIENILKQWDERVFL